MALGDEAYVSRTLTMVCQDPRGPQNEQLSTGTSYQSTRWCALDEQDSLVRVYNQSNSPLIRPGARIVALECSVKDTKITIMRNSEIMPMQPRHLTAAIIERARHHVLQPMNDFVSIEVFKNTKAKQFVSIKGTVVQVGEVRAINIRGRPRNVKTVTIKKGNRTLPASFWDHVSAYEVNKGDLIELQDVPVYENGNIKGVHVSNMDNVLLPVLDGSSRAYKLITFDHKRAAANRDYLVLMDRGDMAINYHINRDLLAQLFDCTSNLLPGVLNANLQRTFMCEVCGNRITSIVFGEDDEPPLPDLHVPSAKVSTPSSISSKTKPANPTSSNAGTSSRKDDKPGKSSQKQTKKTEAKLVMQPTKEPNPEYRRIMKAAGVDNPSDSDQDNSESSSESPRDPEMPPLEGDDSPDRPSTVSTANIFMKSGSSKRMTPSRYVKQRLGDPRCADSDDEEKYTALINKNIKYLKERGRLLSDSEDEESEPRGVNSFIDDEAEEVDQKSETESESGNESFIDDRSVYSENPDGYVSSHNMGSESSDDQSESLEEISENIAQENELSDEEREGNEYNEDIMEEGPHYTESQTGIPDELKSEFDTTFTEDSFMSGVDNLDVTTPGAIKNGPASLEHSSDSEPAATLEEATSNLSIEDKSLDKSVNTRKKSILNKLQKVQSNSSSEFVSSEKKAKRTKTKITQSTSEDQKPSTSQSKNHCKKKTSGLVDKEEGTGTSVCTEEQEFNRIKEKPVKNTKDLQNVSDKTKDIGELGSPSKILPKRGRPKGSKNKPKETALSKNDTADKRKLSDQDGPSTASINKSPLSETTSPSKKLKKNVLQATTKKATIKRKVDGKTEKEKTSKDNQDCTTETEQAAVSPSKRSARKSPRVPPQKN